MTYHSIICYLILEYSTKINHKKGCNDPPSDPPPPSETDSVYYIAHFTQLSPVDALEGLYNCSILGELMRREDNSTPKYC